MFGIIFGTLCLIAFVSVLVRRRRWGYGRGYGCGGHWGRTHRWGLYGLFQELDTSPGQEKAIRAALGDFRRTWGELARGFDSARGELASTLREERFDAERLEASIESHSAELAQLTRAVSAAFGKTHEALDPDQRRRLARIIETGRGHCAA
jgi:Spy/CpxP family protein refolding chaperone